MGQVSVPPLRLRALKKNSRNLNRLIQKVVVINGSDCLGWNPGLRTVWPWADHFTSLCHGFLICKMVIIMQ